MYGGSTGGWIALAQLVFYPHVFGLCIANAPDPVDFHALGTLDLYDAGNEQNAYLVGRPSKGPRTRMGAPAASSAGVQAFKRTYRVDMRERTLEIAPQAAITKDNVSVDVSGNVYVQFVDPERAAYGSQNPLYAVRQLAQSAMRAAIGEMELDEILHARARLNDVIREALAASGRAWGIDIKRYEITEITPDKHISEAMDKQAASERERREKVKMAEGDKQAMTLASEGVRARIAQLRTQFEGMSVLLGVDRVDYIKGIPQKLLAFEALLHAHPELVGKAVLLQIAVPTRTEVPEYQRLRAVAHRLADLRLLVTLGIALMGMRLPCLSQSSIALPSARRET